MSDAPPRVGRAWARPGYWLGALLLGHALVATGLCRRTMSVLGPDQTSYLDLASQLAAGHPAASVSGHWSPLIIWLSALLLRCGAAGPVALHVVGTVAGSLWMLGAWFLAVRYRLPVGARLVVAAVVGLWAARYAATGSGADLCLTAALTWYWWAATHPDLSRRTWPSVVVGVLGGLAYLAKAYALPFVGLHYALSCILRARTERSVEPGAPSTYWRSWLVGTVTLVLVAAPWVAALSGRYGGLIISTLPESGRRQLDYGTDEGRWYQRGLHAPRPGALSVWVDPAAYERAHPDEAPVRLTWAKRVRLFAGNVLELRDKVVRRLDVAGLAPAALCLLVVVVAGRLRAPANGGLEWPAWTLLTFLCYVSGYLLTGVPAERYYLPAWMLLFLNTLALACWGQTLLAARSRVAGRLLGLLVAGSLLVGGLNVVADQARFRDPGTEQTLGRQLRALPVVAPLAVEPRGYTPSDRDTWSVGLKIAYWAGLQYLGVPNGTEPQRMAAELEAAGVRTFLVRPEDLTAGYLAGRAGWRQVGQITAAGQGGQLIRYEVLAFAP